MIFKSYKEKTEKLPIGRGNVLLSAYYNILVV